MKVKNCGVRMASSDITFIKTGSIAPRQSACKQVVRCPCGNYPSTQCIRDVVGYRSVWILWKILTLPCTELRFLNFVAHSWAVGYKIGPHSGARNYSSRSQNVP